MVTMVPQFISEVALELESLLGLYIDDDYTVHLVKWMINIYPRKIVALGLNRLSCLI